MEAPATNNKRSIVTEPVSLQPLKKQTLSLSMPDWSLLPKELLHLISTHVDNCFDLVHARSVCSPWRSTFPFPSFPSYSLPNFFDFPWENKDLCIIEKVPLFLFRTNAPVAPVAPVAASGSLVQNYVQVKFPRPEPTLLNVHDKILPLGHQYRMTGKVGETIHIDFAFLPLNKEGGGEFVVLTRYHYGWLVLRSAEMRWMRYKNIPESGCNYLVTFKGNFYAVFHGKDVFVIDPYLLEATRLTPIDPRGVLCSYMVSSTNDELFLVEEISIAELLQFKKKVRSIRVSKLDEKAGKFIVVRDIGGIVLFINGEMGNCSCSAKELPDSCGVSGNSVLFTHDRCNETYCYNYVKGCEEEDNQNFWRFSRKINVTTLIIIGPRR